MKRKSSGLTEVQRQPSRDGPSPSLIAPGGGVGAAFAIHLPEGAAVVVSSGFEADEVFALLTVVREALR
jgi:hypothetical protein